MALAWFNGYDNSIYVVGRGSSATTVDAPSVGIAFGNSLVIRGTVLDTSTGTQQGERVAKFPHGVPVSSDDSMKDWMAYVYQQKPLPTDFTGVQIEVSVTDSNGNYRQIGTAQTDENGYYILGTDIPGDYQAFAQFAKQRILVSHVTSFTVDEAAPA
jgi:hypothetical protein